mmetsp:Transcript_14811/g.47331  ORF Transcript_14811/g.47331 Transcript_14811/m.47331 type:complete len:374 (+) Transcript_14811:134-1255(+)
MHRGSDHATRGSAAETSTGTVFAAMCNGGYGGILQNLQHSLPGCLCSLGLLCQRLSLTCRGGCKTARSSTVRSSTGIGGYNLLHSLLHGHRRSHNRLCSHGHLCSLGRGGGDGALQGGSRSSCAGTGGVSLHLACPSGNGHGFCKDCHARTGVGARHACRLDSRRNLCGRWSLRRFRGLHLACPVGDGHGFCKDCHARTAVGARHACRLDNRRNLCSRWSLRRLRGGAAPPRPLRRAAGVDCGGGAQALHRNGGCSPAGACTVGLGAALRVGCRAAPLPGGAGHSGHLCSPPHPGRPARSPVRRLLRADRVRRLLRCTARSGVGVHRGGLRLATGLRRAGGVLLSRRCGHIAGRRTLRRCRRHCCNPCRARRR